MAASRAGMGNVQYEPGTSRRARIERSACERKKEACQKDIGVSLKELLMAKLKKL